MPDEAPCVVRASGEARSERSAPAPDDAAYVFFTSGSTGTPKGFVGRHNGLSHMLVWQRDEFSIDEHDRCAQIISLRADASLRDIFTPVISGARLADADESVELTELRLLFCSGEALSSHLASRLVDLAPKLN